ncbi:MAG: hypothetical protein GW886_14140 [Rhodobacterales bacterium]|nr:hypothetical protein [Rhodobacterales bacterium]
MLDMMKRGLRAGATPLVAAVAVMAIAAPVAAADKSDKNTYVQLIPLEPVLYPQVQTAALNLLAVGQPRARTVLRVPVYGSGSYVCSPAGSGMRSQCYRR